ncbi:MAG TPA: bifunctional nuclease family protein [Ignavibacteriaceae bacterium]|nr:bifunctional nuclease family protein [Ignavibacteriaceae bacterium]
MHKIQCEILGLSTSPAAGGAYALLLKEINGNRRLPIIIGPFEANAIALELEGSKPPRPLTHDLIKNLIDNLSASVLEIVIDELKDNTFYAKIVLEIAGLTNEIDSRPSDAIALALRAKVPIYVNEIVMEVASFTPNEEIEGEQDVEDSYDAEDKAKTPISKEALIAALQDKLREALSSEDYERAAKIRDDIKRLTSNN